MESLYSEDLVWSNSTTVLNSSQLHGFIYVHLIYIYLLFIIQCIGVLNTSELHTYELLLRREKGGKHPSSKASWLCPIGVPLSALILSRNGLFLPKGSKHLLQNTSPMPHWCQMLTVQKGSSWQSLQAQITQMLGTESCSNMQPFTAIPRQEESRQPILCRAYQKQSLLWKSTDQDQGLHRCKSRH